MNSSKSSIARYLAHLVAFTATYAILSELGGNLAYPSLFAGPIWPAAGFALGVLLLAHRPFWPGIFLGSLVHLGGLHQVPVPTMLMISAANTIETVLAAYLLRKGWQQRRSLDRVKDVLYFAILVAPLSSALCAALGVAGLRVGNIITASQAAFAFWVWLFADMLGQLVLVPLILKWSSPRTRKIPDAIRLEALTATVLGLVIGYTIFAYPRAIMAGPYPIAYLIFPLVIWAALRLEQFGVVTAVFTISTIAIVSTRLGSGPFFTGNGENDLFRLQTFIGVISITGLVLGAVVCEHLESQTLLKRLLEQQRTLISSIDGIVWEADAHTFKFKFVSQQAERLLGYPIEQWTDNPNFWKDHIHPDDREWAVDFCLDCINNAKAHDFEYRMIAADGREVWLRDIVSVELENGKPTTLRGIMVDVTDKKKIEQKREEFLAISAHELRTPLTPIKLQMHVLKKQLSESDISGSQQQRVSQTLASANAQLERLTQMVEKLLDISQITLGQLKLSRQSCDLSSIIQSVVDRHQIEIINARSKLSIDLTPHAEGYWDPFRLEQVVSNLVTNAVKYGAGNPIEIQSRIEKHKAILVVRDHGIGISPLDQKRIFNRFERGVSISRYGGIGLGLYISRLIVEKHGGSISVDSSPHEGASFIVELPAA